MQQRFGAEEACWAHNPKVRRSKRRIANVLILSIIFSRRVCFLFLQTKCQSCCFLSVLILLLHFIVLKPTVGRSGSRWQQRFGAEEACWAHNPKVRRSKRRIATISEIFSSFVFPTKIVPAAVEGGNLKEPCWAHNPKVCRSKLRILP